MSGRLIHVLTALSAPYKNHSHLLVFSFDWKDSDSLLDIDTFSSTPYLHLQYLPAQACRYVDSTGELLVGTLDFLTMDKRYCKIYLVNLHSNTSREVLKDFCTKNFQIDEEMGLVFSLGSKLVTASFKIIRMTTKGDNIKILKTFQHHKRIAVDVVHKLIYFSGKTNEISSMTYEGKLGKPVVITESEHLDVLYVDPFLLALYYQNATHLVSRSLIPPGKIAMALIMTVDMMVGHGRSAYGFCFAQQQVNVLTDGKTFMMHRVPRQILTLCTIP